MPQRQQSFRLTERYRARLFALRGQVQSEARKRWPNDPAATDYPAQMAAVVQQAQTTALRLTGAYLTAFIASETGKATRAISLDTRAYIGLTADGKPLADGLQSPLIGALGALKRGRPFEIAQKIGIDRATRQVGMHYDHAHRTALHDAIEADERFSKGARAVRGTCGACAALSGSPHMEVHPGCQCVEEPEVAGTSQRFPRPTGAALFAAKSTEQQDEMLGPEAAQRVRDGELEVADLVKHDRLDSETPNFVSQKPVQEATQ